MNINKVLVLIPTIERPQLCKRAIESVRNQTFDDWHLLVVKNGARRKWDEYVNMLNEYVPTSAITTLALPDSGLGYALNHGINWIGLDLFQYVAILEDDDEWKSTFLDTMVREIETSGADVVHCKQLQVPVKRQFDGHQMDLQKIRYDNFINLPMMLWRTELWKTVGEFDENAGPATDWDWTLRCIQAGTKYHFVDEDLVTHHWHRENWCLKEDGRPYIMQKMARGNYD